ncbi:MAG: hypothetical protein KY455_05835 [Euryarchaeota archaeon]|nr:hypothetical protein [Euryarchaeota archaeon]
MTHAPLGGYLNMVGGLVVLVLGLLVLVPKPRRRAGIAFSVFAAGVGGFYFAHHFGVILHAPEGPRRLVESVMMALGLVGVLAMLVTFPSPLSRRERSLLAVSLGVGVLLVVPLLVARHGGEAPVAGSLYALSVGSLYTLFLILSLRFARSNDAVFRRQGGFAAGGLALFVGFQAGGGIDFAGASSLLRAEGAALAGAVLRFAMVLLVAALWLSATRGPEARLARNVALITLAATLAGVLSVTLSLPGGHGIARVIMALVLAYGILRHQLLGIDVKIKWTIRQSTVAAIFIGIFFIASESAAVFLGEKWGTYGGIIAAGGLVFAIAPLQQFAERVADHAMPGVKATSEMTQDERLSLYRAQLIVAYRDAAVDANERELLEITRRRLRIDAEVALSLEREAAGQAAAVAPAQEVR